MLGGAVAALGHKGCHKGMCTATLEATGSLLLRPQRSTPMWPHGWRRGKPVESTILWILSRMYISIHYARKMVLSTGKPRPPRAEASRMRAPFSDHKGYLMYIHGLPKGHVTTMSMVGPLKVCTGVDVLFLEGRREHW